MNNSFASESGLDAKQRLIKPALGSRNDSARLNWKGYDESARKQIQKAVFDQLDLFLQPLIRPVPLILEDVANQGQTWPILVWSMATKESDVPPDKLRIYGFNGQWSKQRSLVEQGEREPHYRRNSSGSRRMVRFQTYGGC
jgi:hypothetical protein